MKKIESLKLPITPLLTVDCVVFDSQGNLLLIRRKNPPFTGRLALPGGFVEIGENVEKACRRELLEETGNRVKKLQLVGIYSDPHRDPRGHVCSVVFASRVPKKIAKASDDASEVLWVHSWRKSELAFDHYNIISDAIKLIRELKSNK